jgi:diguanylate cyclase (GGDEF)-like protein
VLSDAEDMETVLTSIATTIAAVTKIDYISIDLVEADGTVKLRCLPSPRPGTEELTERWKQGAKRADPVRDAVISTRMPMLFADAQRDERVPASGRNFFVRTLIRSTGVLPLLTKDEVLGVLSLASHRPIPFTADEVDLYEGLATQVATAVKGIQLYHQLAESRGELQRLNAQLQESMGIEHHLARTDTLTGIPNRRFIEETVNTEVARAKRYGQQLSLVMADVDDLKSINDEFGHACGDEMLRFVAELARGTCRNVDVVGRYGGDEFLFVLPATGREEAAAFAERFRRCLAESPVPTVSGGTLHVTASFGVSQWDDHMDEAASLIRQADRAMYAAKTDGRNRTMVAIGNAARAA